MTCFNSCVASRWAAITTATTSFFFAVSSPTVAQTVSRRLPPPMPVPLPARTLPPLTLGNGLVPTELEILESIAPGTIAPGTRGARALPPSGPLPVPGLRIPIGNVGDRRDVSDVSTLSSAQLPWNVRPDIGGHPHVGGAGSGIRPSLALQALPRATASANSQVHQGVLSPASAYPQTYPQTPAASYPQAPSSRAAYPQAIAPQALSGLPTVQVQPWRYRIFIAVPPNQTQANQLQAQLRSWVPDAFVTWVQGQQVLQLGSFDDRNRADRLIYNLRRLGLWPQVEITSQT